MSRIRSAYRGRTGQLPARALPICIQILAASLLAPSDGWGQYMYLDSNGDGVHTSADRMNKSTPTTIDVWLDTDSDRDGTPATCDFGGGAMDISSYEFVLQAVGGTVSWGALTNQMSTFTSSFVRDARDTTGAVYYHNGRGGGAAQPPGLYWLARLSATVATGSPRIDIITRHQINRTGRTSFGSECVANATYDHVNRFGANWLDADGLDSPIDAPPRVIAPELVLPQDGAMVSFGVSAGDPDGDAILTLAADLTGLPPGHDAVFTADPPQTSGAFSWTPTVNDSGDYAVTFTATNFLPGSRTTVIHVIGTPTGVGELSPPAVNRLSQNRPNPFNPGTTIDFALAEGGRVRIAVYDPYGRFVRELIATALTAGPHSVPWDGTDERGRPVASGVYWSRLEAGSIQLSRRMVLLR